MRVVRLQGCLPVLLFLVVTGGLLALAFTAGAVFLVAGLALALAGAAVRWLTGAPRGPRPPPAPAPRRARDMIVETEGGTRPPPVSDPAPPPRDSP